MFFDVFGKICGCGIFVSPTGLYPPGLCRVSRSFPSPWNTPDENHYNPDNRVNRPDQIRSSADYTDRPRENIFKCYTIENKYRLILQQEEYRADTDSGDDRRRSADFERSARVPRDTADRND
jgi:hypothetical protein